MTMMIMWALQRVSSISFSWLHCTGVVVDDDAHDVVVDDDGDVDVDDVNVEDEDDVGFGKGVVH